MESPLILYVLATYLLAGFVKGFSGLGFSTVGIGILASFIDLTVAIPLVTIPAIASSLILMLDAGGFRDAASRFSFMYIAALPGVAVGVGVLVAPEVNVAKTVLGFLLCIYGAWALINPTFTLSKSKSEKLLIPTGFTSGLLGGLTGVAVFPVTPYLLSLNLQREFFVQSLNISFVITSTLLMLILGGIGYISLPTFVISVGAILPVAIAVKVGALVRRRFTEKYFKVVVTLVLIGLGINLVEFT